MTVEQLTATTSEAMSVKRIIAATGVLIFFASAAALAASRPAAEQRRIDWLIEEVRNSRGVFIRNGEEYPASKAVSHLKFKLMMAGKRVQTVRDFIDGVASHSQESGKPYQIGLPGQPARSMKDWLNERLAEFEKGAAGVKR
ncbi:MAG: DUF5329 domain-containing protein [Acidobacteria bacterium]|nr:DUF5329 domain-containing protein [Acidobacteriota bacterium]MCA1609938.1 DUF5329 domain-containing protein [Acidobacteriota bacterium]